MKFDYSELREAGGAAEEAAKEAGEAVTEAAGEAAGEAAKEAGEAGTPTMDLEMTPEGTNASIQAPLEDMSASEAIELAEQYQKPGLGEQVADILTDPEARAFLDKLLFGGGEEGQGEAPSGPKSMSDVKQQIEAQSDNQPESDTETMAEEAKTDGGSGGANAQMNQPQVPEGMDVDKAYDMLESTVSSLPEDTEADEMIFLSQMLHDLTENVTEARPDATVGQVESYMGQFEGQIKQELKQLMGL